MNSRAIAIVALLCLVRLNLLCIGFGLTISVCHRIVSLDMCLCPNSRSPAQGSHLKPTTIVLNPSESITIYYVTELGTSGN